LYLKFAKFLNEKQNETETTVTPQHEMKGVGMLDALLKVHNRNLKYKKINIKQN